MKLILTFPLVILHAALLSTAKGDGSCRDEEHRCPKGWQFVMAGQCFLRGNVTRDYEGALMSCQAFDAELPKENTIRAIIHCLEPSAIQETVWLGDDLWSSMGKAFNFTSNTTVAVSKELYQHIYCVRPTAGHRHNMTLLFGIRASNSDHVTPFSDSGPHTIVLLQPHALICELQHNVHAILKLKENGTLLDMPYSTLSDESPSISYTIGRKFCPRTSVNFTCEAENLIESASRSVELVIECPQNIVSFNVTSDPSYPQKTKPGSYRIGDNAILNCTVDAGGVNLPDVYIRRKHGHQLNTENTGIPNVLVSRLDTVDCDDMGTYVCEATYSDGIWDQQEINIGIQGCSPILCHSEENTQRQLEISSTDQTKQLSLCVIAYPKLNELASFNNETISRGEEHPVFVWDYTDAADFSSFIVTVTLHNVSSLTQEKLQIHMFTSDEKQLVLTYSIVPKESDMPTPEVPDMDSEEENNSYTPSPGIILAITFGIILFLLIVVVLAALWIKRKGRPSTGVTSTAGRQSREHDCEGVLLTDSTSSV